mmetsp:Transcript_18868/g.61929  ORF Transcript_18868/g.61929 Transcript_18868/m.61929 type:complete len:209 (+) Transcript_18868:1981-2607(+)
MMHEAAIEDEGPHEEGGCGDDAVEVVELYLGETGVVEVRDADEVERLRCARSEANSIGGELEVHVSPRHHEGPSQEEEDRANDHGRLPLASQEEVEDEDVDRSQALDARVGGDGEQADGEEARGDVEEVEAGERNELPESMQREGRGDGEDLHQEDGGEGLEEEEEGGEGEVEVAHDQLVGCDHGDGGGAVENSIDEREDRLRSAGLV